jgi:hypothetical protein
MTLMDITFAMRALSWDDLSRILICVACSVWLIQQVHADIRDALHSIFLGIVKWLAYVLIATVCAYFLLTQIDWTHIGNTTFQAGLRAFVDSTFAKKSEL